MTASIPKEDENTQKVRNVFCNQMVQDNVPIFKEFLLCQANKHANPTFKMKMSKEKNK